MNGVVLAGKTDGCWSSQEESFDPQRGWELTDTYKGTEQAMRSARDALTMLGLKCRLIRNEGTPVWELQATKPSIDLAQGGSGTTQETPVEKWELKTEMVQLPIWNHPAISGAMDRYSINGAAVFKKIITDAVKNGTAIPVEFFLELIPTDQAIVQSVYNLLVRGVEAYEVKRHTLHRTKSYSAVYTERATVNATEIYYMTDQLKFAFGVPLLIGSKLPADPLTKPSGTNWGWRMRTNSQTFTRGTNKVEEITDWIFAAWSTFLYAAYVP